MTSLEKAINLGYLFLTFKPKKKKNINTCTTLFCMYWYVSIYSEECFWPQCMYHKTSPNNGYRWYTLGKLSHLGLEQLPCSRCYGLEFHHPTMSMLYGRGGRSIRRRITVWLYVAILAALFTFALEERAILVLKFLFYGVQHWNLNFRIQIFPVFLFRLTISSRTNVSISSNL